MTDRRAAVLYAFAFLPVTVAAVLVSGWVMDVSKRHAPRMPATVTDWSLNVVPAFATAFIAYVLVARYVRGRSGGAGHRRTHVRRSAVLYVTAIALGVLLLHDGPRPEFWSFGQLVLWVWLSAAAGIAADALVVERR